MLPEGVDGVHSTQLSATQDGHTVADQLDFLQQVAVQKDRFTLALQPAEHLANLGATDGVDPNQYRERRLRPGATGTGDARGASANASYQDALVDHLREMCKMKNDRLFIGGGRIGPDHIIEAVGGDRMKPKEVQGPDPTGVTVLQQCWELCSTTGSLVTCSVGHPVGAMVQIPAAQWADGAKHHWPGTAGGTNCRRDDPRYIKMMETGQLNMKALAAKTYPLSQAREAYQVCADRTVVATIVTPNV